MSLKNSNDTIGNRISYLLMLKLIYALFVALFDNIRVRVRNV